MNILMLKKDKKTEDNIIKDARNLFRLKKERNSNTSKDIRNLLLNKKDEAIKGRVLRDITKLFEKGKKDYYKLVENFGSRNYIEFESNRDRNKALSIKEYLNKIRPYLTFIINDLKKSETWKIQLTWKSQLTIAITFISSKDTDEERAMHSKGNSIEIMINDKADKE